MGSKQSFSKGQLENKLPAFMNENVPIYALGFSENLKLSAEEEETNKILLKLKDFQASQMFKYRVKQQPLLKYFLKYSINTILIISYMTKKPILVLIYLSEESTIKIKNVMMILRKEMNTQSHSSIFLMKENGRLCNTHESLQHQNEKNKQDAIVLYYSEMQVTG